MTASPHALAAELETLSAEYSSMSDEAAAIKMRKPFLWAELRAGKKTNGEADNAYHMTEDGQRTIYLDYKMEANSKRMSAIKSVLRTAENEARGMM